MVACCFPLVLCLLIAPIIRLDFDFDSIWLVTQANVSICCFRHYQTLAYTHTPTNDPPIVIGGFVGLGGRRLRLTFVEGS